MGCKAQRSPLSKQIDKACRPFDNPVYHYLIKRLIQAYEADGLGNEWWPDVLPGTYGVDHYIGERGLIGKGIGTMILQRFVQNLFEDGRVQAVITDPKPDNERAVRSYEKAGFLKSGVINTPDGEALLMVMKRQPGFPLARE